MTDSKTIKADSYARLALAQIPRILTLQDRNPMSRTYGSFARTFWLDRTSDFPTALAQYATHALALAWAHEMPGNVYRGHPKILQWVFAGMENFIATQHDDGSFDEFYPQERGWAGPTGFLIYAMADSYIRVKREVPAGLKDRLLKAIAKGGEFLCSYDEIGTLANHYAMAALAIRIAHHVTGDDSLLRGYEAVLEKTLGLFDEEGWGLEYDGADIGYLSASVSFFAKIEQIAPDERIEQATERAVAFSSYFVYPDGHFAGTLGSRNTLHFYPHGYELLAEKNPLAARIADAMIDGLESGALVPPHIMADRYFLYRVPEYLLSYIDHADRPPSEEKLPYERDDFVGFFPRGRFYAAKKKDAYCVVNAGKGGVVKCFDVPGKRLVYADSGILVEKDGHVAGSQWIDPEYRVSQTEGGVSVSGQLHRLPQKHFTPVKMILFRLFLVCFGWNTALAYRLKGWIRRLLMLRHKSDSARFSRTIRFDGNELVVLDELRVEPGAAVLRVLFGDDVPVRYVPQSRYFQPQELSARGWWATPEQIGALSKGPLKHERRVDLANGDATVSATDSEGRNVG